MAAAPKMWRKTVRSQIANFLRKRPVRGATCDEVEAKLGIAHQTASARLHDLERDAEVERTTQRRRTRSGATARVYRSLDDGLEVG